MRNRRKLTSDEILDDMRFAEKIIKNAWNVETLQCEVRKIILRYGWNPAMYPQYTKYAFWTLISGDAWGAFKRKVLQKRKDRSVKVDPRDPDVVKY